MKKTKFTEAQIVFSLKQAESGVSVEIVDVNSLDFVVHKNGGISETAMVIEYTVCVSYTRFL